MQIKDNWLLICEINQLEKIDFIIKNLHYNSQPSSAIIFQFNGNPYAYLNQCVHMPKRLNCESDTVFDKTREHLRCSMHGIIYDPENGASLSTMCEGQQLKTLRLTQLDGNLYISDKNVAPFVENY